MMKENSGPGFTESGIFEDSITNAWHHLMRLPLLFISLILIILSPDFKAQTEGAASFTIKPIWIEARVLGLLEDHGRLAVIQVKQVASINEFNLAAKSEVLTEFIFGAEASDGDPKIPGVKSGDAIRAEIHGKFNPTSGQWEYRIFRYSQLKITESGKE